jgi:hypothetical protein
MIRNYSKPVLTIVTNCNKKGVRHYARLKPDVIDSIKSIVGSGNFSDTDSIRQHHSKDESFHK